MHSFKLLSAVVAIGAGVVSAKTCTKDIEISEPTPSIDCDVVDADITISSELAGDIVIDGPKQIKGNLIISNATGVRSVSSTSINNIDGEFNLVELINLNSVNMPSLRGLNQVKLQRLTNLADITFGASGLTRINSVEVSDTFLDRLDNFNVATVEIFRADNNRRLVSFESDLEEIGKSFVFTNNGQNNDGIAVKLNKLEKAAVIEISDIKSISIPKLSKVNGSLNFYDNPKLESFSAPNLTEIAQDISFIHNDGLTNMSFPKLTKLSGGLKIDNNAKLIELTGFPKLETVAGGLNITGDFEEIELPALENVRGSSNVFSSTDIEDFCKFFDDAKSDGRISGQSSCKSNEKDAATDGGNNKGGSDDDDDEDDGDDSAAGLASANMALLAAAAFVGLFQLL